MTFIVQSYFDTLLRYVLSVTFCGAVVLEVMDQKTLLKVARYSFSGSIPPKFEDKLRRHKQRFGKIGTTVVLNED